MKRLFSILAVSLAAVPLFSFAVPPNEGVTVTYSGALQITWSTQPGWSYFVVCSTDLRNWVYYPVSVIQGDGLQRSLLLNLLIGNSSWARLRFAYRPAGNPLDGDSDGDGLSDSAEILAGLDPLEIDSNGDGLADISTPLSGTSVSGAPEITLLSPPGATQVP
jgi:hypothetical protein